MRTDKQATDETASNGSPPVRSVATHTKAKPANTRLITAGDPTAQQGKSASKGPDGYWVKVTRPPVKLVAVQASRAAVCEE